jgi:hypothetical protein
MSKRRVAVGIFAEQNTPRFLMSEWRREGVRYYAEACGLSCRESNKGINFWIRCKVLSFTWGLIVESRNGEENRLKTERLLICPSAAPPDTALTLKFEST